MTKLEAEKWLHNFASQNSLDYTVLRPTGIYGPGDRRLLKIFRMAKWPLYPILGSGKCYYHLIHVDDLTDCFLHAAVHPKASGQAFIVGNQEPIQLEKMVEIIGAHLKTSPRPIRLPVGPFFVAGDICEAICKPLGVEPPLYRRRVAFFTKDRWFQTEKMRSILEFHPKFDNKSGLIETAEWYQKQGWL